MLDWLRKMFFQGPTRKQKDDLIVKDAKAIKTLADSHDHAQEVTRVYWEVKRAEQVAGGTEWTKKR